VLDPDDEALRALLEGVRSIAVLGLKDGPGEDSFRVSGYLLARGYRVVPVNPKLGEVLGERAVASLADAPGPIDLVDVFRASAHVSGHVDEILALSPRPACVWLQLGVRSEEAAARLAAAGVTVVQDRCIMVEHRRLFGDL
jgi:predicted CoA-binding protein